MSFNYIFERSLIVALQVENSVKPSSKDTLASRPMARNLKGVGDLAEDLSHISDAEVIKKNSIYLCKFFIDAANQVYSLFMRKFYLNFESHVWLFLVSLTHNKLVPGLWQTTSLVTHVSPIVSTCFPTMSP